MKLAWWFVTGLSNVELKLLDEVACELLASSASLSSFWLGPWSGAVGWGGRCQSAVRLSGC